MEVLKGAATKYNFIPHYPGPGVGGPCLPSNPYYLINDGYKVSFTPNLVRLATEINQRQPAHIMNLIFEGLNENKLPISGTKIALVGLSYKPDVKDVQISPVIPIIEDLKKYGAELKIYDPYYEGEEMFGLPVQEDYQYIKEGYPIVIIHTDHQEFHSDKFKGFLKQCPDLKVVVDCHNILEYEELPDKIYYIGVGRPIYLSNETKDS
jgi:nucleotide sugar dehydrogenase